MADKEKKVGHRKKKFDDLLKGKYPRENLKNAVRDVVNGVQTSAEAAKYYGVKQRTIQEHAKETREEAARNEEGKYEDIPSVKDYRGPDPSLDSQIEERIRIYVRDCGRIGLPRIQNKFLLEIKSYLEFYNIDVTRFKDGKPGPDYLKRVCRQEDGQEVTFLSQLEVSAKLNEQYEVNSWMAGVRQYLMDVNEEQLIGDKRLVYLIESQVFLTNTTPQRPISVMMISNGQGQIIRWIIVTDGNLATHDWVQDEGVDILLLKTNDGRLTPTILRNAIIIITRNYEENQVEGDALVLMDHFTSSEFDLCNWDFCCDNFIFPVAIPRVISGGLRALNFGIMARYTHLMLFFMHNRFILMGYEMTELNFILMHKEAVYQVPLRTSQSPMLKMLHINKVVMKPKAPQKEEEEEEEEAQAVEDKPSTSRTALPKPPALPKVQPEVVKSKGKRRKKSGPVEMVTTSTQTTLEMIPLDMSKKEEEKFDRFYLQSMRQRHLVRTIRAADFEDQQKKSEKSDPEASTSGTALPKPPAVPKVQAEVVKSKGKGIKKSRPVQSEAGAASRN